MPLREGWAIRSISGLIEEKCGVSKISKGAPQSEGEIVLGQKSVYSAPLA
jgi:hypothetical protein